jgi:hypothetical protein
MYSRRYRWREVDWVLGRKLHQGTSIAMDSRAYTQVKIRIFWRVLAGKQKGLYRLPS